MMSSLLNSEASGSIYEYWRGTWLGTSGYFAPEQLLGRSYDGKVDVFAMGVIAFTLIGVRWPLGYCYMINLLSGLRAILPSR